MERATIPHNSAYMYVIYVDVETLQEVDLIRERILFHRGQEQVKSIPAVDARDQGNFCDIEKSQPVLDILSR